MKDSTSAESRTTCEARTRTFWISKSVLSVAPAGCAPAFSDHSAVVASANSLRSVGRAAQTARDGGRALTVVRQRVGLWVSSQVVLAKAVSSALAHPGQVLVRASAGVRKPSSGIALRGVCCRGCGLGSSLDCTKSSR